ncbi:MAG: hypothetical protein SO414_08150, partial [Bacteroidaceae bacterium]|nr:hypothetical protein [Bacteroidaceae bacterium]
MSKHYILPLFIFLLTVMSCGGEESIPPREPETPVPGDSIEVPDTTSKDSTQDIQVEDFARGAEISWYSQM